MNSHFKVKYTPIVKEFKKWSVFKSKELECLLLIYFKLCLATGRPNTEQPTRKHLYEIFVEQFEILDDLTINSIIDYFAQGHFRLFNAESWIKMIEMMMCQDLEKQIKFVYDIYLSKGRVGAVNISREVVARAAKLMFAGDDDDDEINDLRQDMADLLLSKFDLDKDGVISFEEYSAVVRKKPPMLEFLGQCLPPSPETRTVVALCLSIYTQL